MPLTWKLIGIGIVLATIAGIIAHDHWISRKYQATKAELVQANATITAERENTRKANEAAQRFQARSDALEADKRDNPLPAVRVCKSARVPKTGTATVVNEAAQADNPPADEGDRDIGPALDEFATDAEANLIQCQELQKWVQSR
jgi:hypothetical protein